MENYIRAGRRFPATLPLFDVRGRSPGSEDLVHRLPEPDASAQWHLNGLTLPYRCGGSTGIAPKGMALTCFPFHPAAKAGLDRSGTADMHAT